MTSTTTAEVNENTPGLSLPFVVASRVQRRFSNIQTVNNAVSGGSFAPIPLPATGWVRRVTLFFTQNVNYASAAAVTNGDGPFRLINGITLTDATGQPVMQPINGYNLYLVNKYSGRPQSNNIPCPYENPVLSPEYTYSTSGGTSGTATFRLDIDFELDSTTGYGCIPNLDSNASLQLKIDYAAVSAAFTGTTVGTTTLSVRVGQEYYAPVPGSINGVAVSKEPPGAGDYLETRIDTQVVSAVSENLVTLTARGGMIKDLIVISRAAGTRVPFTAGSNVGIMLDNQPINEGVTLEEHYDYHRRAYGYTGTDVPVSGNFAPVTPGVMSGLDVGVIPISFDILNSGRQGWLNTRAGSLFQIKVTPGPAATELSVITRLSMVRDFGQFYAGRN